MVGARQAILSPDLSAVGDLAPLAGATRLAGVRVYDVGQGDAIAILNDNGDPIIHFDYGGNHGNPFGPPTAVDPDVRMPVTPGELLLLSHWDEDHWCSARKGSAVRKASWLVPRQVTSPRAAVFSATLDNVRCIPEAQRRGSRPHARRRSVHALSIHRAARRRGA